MPLTHPYADAVKFLLTQLAKATHDPGAELTAYNHIKAINKFEEQNSWQAPEPKIDVDKTGDGELKPLTEDELMELAGKTLADENAAAAGVLKKAQESVVAFEKSVVETLEQMSGAQPGTATNLADQNVSSGSLLK